MERSFSAAAQQESALQRLLAFYHALARNPAGITLNALVWLWNSDADEWCTRRDQSISQGFEEIQNRLANDTAAGLSVCAVVASTHNAWGAYTFLTQLWLTVWRCKDEAGTVVRGIMSRLLTKHWATDDEGLIIEELLLEPDIERRPREVRILSSGRQDTLSTLGVSENVLATGTMQPDYPFLRQWKWLKHAPDYDGDVAVYVEQPFKRWPVLDYARLFVNESRIPGQRKAVMVVNSSDTLQRVMETFKRIQQRPRLTHNADLQLALLVLAMYEQMRGDISHYLNAAIRSVDEVVR